MVSAQAPGDQALETFGLLCRYFDGEATVEEIARKAGVSTRTIWRRIKAHQAKGLQGLRRGVRSDKGQKRKIDETLREAIEGLYLRAPKPTVTWVHEQIIAACQSKVIPIPGYTVVWEVCRDLDNRLKVLAHAGDPVYEQNYDILIRREAERPNEVWQCDHKELKVWAIDEFGNVGKVWLTAIIDDYSRVIPGYFLDVRRPNSMKIASALRQAIWFKHDQKWPVSGIPDVFYSDHGKDFKSTHIAQAAADLGMKLVRTKKRKPRGRGKIERFFRTVNLRFARNFSSSRDKPVSLSEFRNKFHAWLLNDYHIRRHREIKTTPNLKWKSGPFLPRLPATLEALDLMLQKVVRTRKMWGDGIRFKNRRYSDMTLSQSRGQEFTIRYDPRDLSCIWVYGEEGKLFCKATCSELTGVSPDPELIIAENARVKKELKKKVTGRRQSASSFVGEASDVQQEPKKEQPTSSKQPKMKLRKYFHERNE